MVDVLTSEHKIAMMGRACQVLYGTGTFYSSLLLPVQLYTVQCRRCWARFAGELAFRKSKRRRIMKKKLFGRSGHQAQDLARQLSQIDHFW